MANENIKKIPFCILLIFCGTFLFAFSNPNIILRQGFAFTAWVMYVPYFFLLKKSSLKNCWFYSGLYGCLSVALYAYWLFNYNPLCFILALIISFAGTAIAGQLLKLIQGLFKKNYWLIWFLCICSFDYIRTLGFIGFHYGLAAYTQWNMNTLAQLTRLTGVFGLNALVIFSSALFFAYFSKLEDKKYILRRMVSDNKHYEGATYVNYVSDNEKLLKNTSLVTPVIFSFVWLFLLIFALVYGHFQLNKTESTKTVTVAAIQHNDDPYSNGFENFREGMQSLINLTDEALEINPGIDLVLWPENAIVPSVMYHYNQKDNTDRKRLVTYVLEYINSRSPSFVIGNQHISVNANGSGKKYYNSSLIFTPGKNVIPPEPELYSKNHLVPFSEYFPYEKFFPHIYKTLLEREKFFVEPGTEIKVSSVAGLDVFTPICFEDTFPDLCRKAYQNGARCFLCLANDSWSKSISCQFQHLGIARFRAIENHVPVIISSVSGQTAIIEPDGSIIAMAEPFTKTYVIADIPVISKAQKPTIYNKTGDIFGYGSVFLLLGVLLIRLIVVIIYKQKRK